MCFFQSLPIVYLYRHTDEAPLPKPHEGQTRGRLLPNMARISSALRIFFKPFRDTKTGAFKAYYHEYDSLDPFDTLMKKHLCILLTHAYERLTILKTGKKCAFEAAFLSPTEPIDGTFYVVRNLLSSASAREH
jgi:hypothetical protein